MDQITCWEKAEEELAPFGEEAREQVRLCLFQAVLLTAGTKGKRSALKHSRVMIHQPMGGANGQASDIEITAREILKLKKELYQIIADHSGNPIKKVEKDADRDYWMTSEEAKAYGMIDTVLTREK